MATFVKKVIVGTPIKKVTSGTFNISSLGGVNISGDAGTGQNIGEGIHNDLLVYDSAAGEYKNLNTLRVLKIDQFTLDSNAITMSNGDPASPDQLYINAADGVFIDGRLEVDRINQKQLTVFDDSSLTTKFYVDQEVEKVKEVTFTMDDGFTDSVQIYDDETITMAGGNGLSTRGIKIGNVLTITTDLDSTGADSGTFGSSIRIPVIKTNSLGQIDSISDVAVASIDSISYDSSLGSGVLSINTSDGGLFQSTINLNPFTTTNLTEGDDIPAVESYTYAVTATGNFFYTVTGTDRNGSVSGGDPALTVRVGDTLTFNNAVWNDHPLLIKDVQGDGLSDQTAGVTGQGTATVTWTPDTVGTYYYQCANHNDMYGVITVLARDEANMYYKRYRFDSALGDSTSRQTIRGYFSTGGDIQYDSTTGVFSVDVEQVYTTTDFDSDLDAAINNSYNIHWYPDSNYFDLGVKTDLDSGQYGDVADSQTYGTYIPMLTVDRFGRIDSAGQYHANLLRPDIHGAWIAGQPGVGAQNQLAIYGTKRNEYVNITNFADSAWFQEDVMLTFGGNYYQPSITKDGKRQGYIRYETVDERFQIGGEALGGVEVIHPTAVSLLAGNFGQTGGQVIVRGDLVPDGDSIYDLGDSLGKWRDLYLSGSTINLGGVSLQDSANSLKIGRTDGGAGGFKTNFIQADSAFISQLTVDSISISQLSLSNADMDSLYVDQLNVSQADVDSLYVDQLNVSQADIDSLFVDTLNIGSIDSAYANNLNVSNLHADSARTENLSVDILNADSVSADFIRFDAVQWDDNAKPTTDEGAVYYNSGPDALVYKPASASPVKIGQDEVTRVYNNSGAMIPKGAPVYVTGAQNDFPTISKAQANDINTIANTIGVLKDSINNASFGLALNRGLVGRIDTSSFSVGDHVFVSADSAGKLVTTAPEYPNFAYEIGTVLTSDSINGPGVGGCISIDPQKEFFEQFRVTGSGRVDQNFTIGGNLTVIGSQVSTSVQSLAVSDTVIELGAGDTIGLASTTFGGSGVNDAALTGHYTGDNVVTYRVRIDSVGTGGEGDKIVWSYAQSFSPLQGFDSANGPTEFVLSAGDKIANLRDGIKVAFTGETGHTLADSWSGEASPVDVQIGIVGNYNPPADSHAYSGFIRDPSDNRWKLFQQYLPDPQANINFGHASLEFAPLQVETLYASTVNADLTGDVTGTVSDISNHTTDQLAEGSTNRYYLASRVDSDILDSIATNNLDVATGDISQFTSDSAFITQLNVSQADIDSLFVDTLNVGSIDSAYATQLNVNQADIDSLYVDQINIATGDIDNLTVDSAYITQLNVATGDIDTFTSADATIDSAYIGQLNVSQAHIDSLYADNINLSLVDIDTFTADSAVITDISGSTANFTTITRSGATSYNGTWGSASQVPVLTLDSSGFVDSIGTVSVAGVTGFAWDSTTSTATISTADGGSYPATINTFHEIASNLIPSFDSTYDLGSASNKWKDLYLSGSTINLGNIKLQDSDGGLKVMHTSGVMAQAKVGHMKADSAAVDLLRVLDDFNGDFRIENNIVQRTYENRDSQNLTAGITQDSNNQGLINIYVRTGVKTGQHRYWKQGSSKGYFLAYDSNHLWTDKEIQAPLLDLLPGVTYRFHHADSSMSTHDIRFYWDNAKSGMLSDSAADIKYIGTAGDKNYGSSYAQIKVADDGPRSFGYQCINHPYMGNLAISNSGAGGRLLGTSDGIKVDGNIEATIDGGTY